MINHSEIRELIIQELIQQYAVSDEFKQRCEEAFKNALPHPLQKDESSQRSLADGLVNDLVMKSME